MYKIISICFCTLLMCNFSFSQNIQNKSKKKHHPIIDSCSILNKLLEYKWSYQVIKWGDKGDSLRIVRDSLHLCDLYHEHPAFMKCFNKMTKDDVKRLFGYPVFWSWLTNDNSYAYCIYASPTSRLTLISFHFKDGYLINIDWGSVLISE